MKYFIITGTSKGLGEALARRLMQTNHHLICISRKKNEQLILDAKNQSLGLDYFEYDFNDIYNIDKLSEKIFSIVDKSKAQGIYLVNNAGTVTPIKPVEKCDNEGIISNVHINLVAPMLLVSAFMKFTSDLNVEKKVISISSGAGKKPFHGWGPYCTSKAGIDMFTQCVGIEEKNKEYPVKILSFGPGIMDTDMQREIRSSSEEDFVMVNDFIGFKEKGNLKSAETVAEVVAKLLLEIDYEQGIVTSVNDYL